MPGKKIIQLSPSYLPHLGGVETHVSQVSERLVKQGESVTVLTNQSMPEMPLKQTINGVKIFRVPMAARNNKIKTWWWMWQHRHIWRQANLIQVHDIFWWVYPFYLFIFQKVYTTFHGWEGTFPVPLIDKLQRNLISFLSRRTLHIGAWIQEFYGDRPSAVVYGGVENRVLLKPRKQHTSAMPNIVFLGRLEAENEIKIYLEMVKKLRKKWPKLLIIWVGDGKYRQACAQYGTVTGMITNPKKYLASANIVFANSYLSILEAQAHAKLVLSTYSNSLKQRYLETYPGHLEMIIGSDSKILSEKMIDVWNNTDCYQQLCARAHQFAQTQSWEKIVNMYQNLWKCKS